MIPVLHYSNWGEAPKFILLIQAFGRNPIGVQVSDFRIWGFLIAET